MIVQTFRGRLVTVTLALAGVLAVGCERSPAERIASIYELKARPTEENVARIRSLLADPDRDVRATALNALVGLRVPDAASIAVQSLDDEDGFVRATAAKLVGDLADPAHAGLLVPRLVEDPDAVVRRRAAEALGRIGGEGAVEGLARGFEDPDGPVRLACVRALRELDPGYDTAGLLRLLRDDIMWEVRVQAATTLGFSEDPEAIDGLNAALEDDNEFVRAAAANALVGREAGAGVAVKPGGTRDGRN